MKDENNEPTVLNFNSPSSDLSFYKEATSVLESCLTCGIHPQEMATEFLALQNKYGRKNTVPTNIKYTTQDESDFNLLARLRKESTGLIPQRVAFAYITGLVTDGEPDWEALTLSAKDNPEYLLKIKDVRYNMGYLTPSEIRARYPECHIILAACEWSTKAMTLTPYMYALDNWHAKPDYNYYQPRMIPNPDWRDHKPIMIRDTHYTGFPPVMIPNPDYRG